MRMARITAGESIPPIACLKLITLWKGCSVSLVHLPVLHHASPRKCSFIRQLFPPRRVSNDLTSCCPISFKEYSLHAGGGSLEDWCCPAEELDKQPTNASACTLGSKSTEMFKNESCFRLGMDIRSQAQENVQN